MPDDVVEEIAGSPPDAGAGDDGAVAGGDDVAHVGESATSEESPKEPADKDRMTPRSAAKLAGIVVGTVLLCAAVVVAASPAPT